MSKLRHALHERWRTGPLNDVETVALSALRFRDLMWGEHGRGYLGLFVFAATRNKSHEVQDHLRQIGADDAADAIGLARDRIGGPENEMAQKIAVGFDTDPKLIPDLGALAADYRPALPQLEERIWVYIEQNREAFGSLQPSPTRGFFARLFRRAPREET